MEHLDVILIIAGLLLFMYYLNKKKENFTPLSYQVNKIPLEIDYGMNYPYQAPDLGDRMVNIFDNEKEIRRNALSDYTLDNSHGFYNSDLGNPNGEIFEDVKKHEYKFERDPKKVINELGKEGPVDMKTVFNKSIKNYKQINSKIQNKRPYNKFDSDRFVVIDDVTISDNNDIKPFISNNNFSSI